MKFIGNYFDKIPTVLNSKIGGESFAHDSASINLTGPAIICGAGPSLDKNIEELKHLDLEKFWVFSVDAASKDLLENDIPTHFTVCCDPGDGLNRFFVPNESLLLHEGSANKDFCIKFSKSVMYHLSHSITKVINNYIFDRNDFGVPAYGSVLNCAISLAMNMGANPIYICGADYAYTGNRSHCKSWSTTPYPEAIIPNGKDFIRTSCAFLAHAKWLESFVDSGFSSGFDIKNATGEGILRIPNIKISEMIGSETKAIVRYSQRKSKSVKLKIVNMLSALYNYLETSSTENHIISDMIEYGSGYVDEQGRAKESCLFFIEKLEGVLDGISS